MNQLHAPAPRDPFLDMPLEGLRLIEASAGTGKTFTLATLVLRLVIERRLRVGEVLAVTFTEAATQELRERLRLRLVLAARLATDPECADASPEAHLTRTLIARQCLHEDAAALAARLRRAAYEIDLAAVFTIHGFCLRVLSEHALESGQAFVAPTLIGSDRELREEVAADLWRTLGGDVLDVTSLHALWASPDAMARDLVALLRAPRMLPDMPDAAPDPLPALQAAANAVREAFAAHGGEARATLDHCLAAGVLDGRKARKPSYEKAWGELEAGLETGHWRRDDGAHIDKLTPTRLRECAKAGREHELPESPVFLALEHWFEQEDARERWLADRRIALLHRLRSEAAGRLSKLKRQRRVQTFDDLIDDLTAALDGPRGDLLASRLRTQYAVALVDEFQDTDARQWAIFDRVFGRGSAAPALFLIGDPKQAIYRFRGGDVHTYLAAHTHADIAPPLRDNFRSRPAVLRAISALYGAAGDTAFVDERIRFVDVQPGGRRTDADFLRDGTPAPALTVRVLPAPGHGDAWKADDSRALATRACVAAIHALLHDARRDAALLDGKPVQPGDIAVLVRSHHEAKRMQCALAAVGIAAVAAGRQSLFDTDEADELLTVFDALLQPGDPRRLRAALATVLLGLDAERVDALDRDGDALRAWQLRVLDWRERWQRHGPLALVSDLVAEQAPRLLALLDGERRLTNLLQLGEELQQADVRALGAQGLVDWLRRRIAEADPDDETQQLRLESDAGRVRILTLHKSKGLEFPLVFLPFAGIGTAGGKPRWCDVIDGATRALHLQPDAAAIADHQREERAEDARLLYVGLTRARHALWLANGPLYRNGTSPLAAMLRDPASLASADIVIDNSPWPPAALPPLARRNAGIVPAARHARRVLDRDWWIHSFTQLANEDAGETASIATGEEGGARDERAAAVVEVAAADPRFAGSRFGNVLHAALERVDFAAWQAWRGEAPPAGESAVLRAALQEGGYPAEELDAGIALLARLVGHTLAVRLPEGVRLSDVPADARRAELEFHFALRSTSVDALLDLLHEHGLLQERHAFGHRRRLEGLMTGKIDLVYAHAGRFHVLDYKSNRLPAYDAATLQAAMGDSEYTLQALLYTLALHRWLRFRLGDDYEYARDVGGVRYLFCRGLDAFAETDIAPGVHAWQPPATLVHALDALFAGAHA